MSEVTLNGEKVDFQGPAPAAAIETWSLLEGIPFVRLEEVAERLAREKVVSWRSGMEQADRLLEAGNSRSLDLDGELEQLFQFGCRVCALALKGALILESTIKGVSAVVKSQIEEARSVRGEVDAFFESNSDWHQVLNDGTLKYELSLYARVTQREKLIEDPITREGDDSLKYFWAIAEGAFSFLSANQADRIVS